MTHLTDEQLSARLDGALAGHAAEAADAHLAACDVCRARLAGLSELDASLAGALEHDPGEAYFASFPGRVAARIAAGSAQVMPVAAGAGGGLARWWNSPRVLALAGGAFAILAVAAIALVWSRGHGVDEFAKQARSSTQRIDTGTPAPAARELQSAPAPAAAKSEQAPAPRAARKAASPTLDERDAGPAAGARMMQPQHVQEVRPLPNGEFEVVNPSPRPVQMAPPPRAPGEPGRIPKPMAQPMAGSPADRKDAVRSFAVPPSAYSNQLGGAQPMRAEDSLNPQLTNGATRLTDRLDTRRSTSAPSMAEASARAEAELLTLKAKQSGTPQAWAAAAEGWQKLVAASGTEAAAIDARYQAASALLQAWRAEPVPARQLAARSAVETFLATAPAGPRRATALLWRTELAGR